MGGLSLLEASTMEGLNIPGGLNSGSIASRRGPQHPRRPKHRRPHLPGCLNMGPRPPGGLNTWAATSMEASAPATSTSRRPQHNGIKCGGHTQHGRLDLPCRSRPQQWRASTVEASTRGPQHPRTPQHLRTQPPGGLNSGSPHDGLTESSTSTEASISWRPQHGGLNGIGLEHPRRPQYRRPYPPGGLNTWSATFMEASTPAT